MEDAVNRNGDDITVNQMSEATATKIKIPTQVETGVDHAATEDIVQDQAKTPTETQTQSDNNNDGNDAEENDNDNDNDNDNANAKEASQLHSQAQTEEKWNEKTQDEDHQTTTTITITTTTTLTSTDNEDKDNSVKTQETQKMKDKKETGEEEKEEKEKEEKVMDELSKKVEIIKQLLKESDSVLIGGGAGLSLAAGLDNAGLKFEENFKDFIDAYGFEDLYHGGFYPFSTLEEKWAYFSRNCVTYIDSKPTPLYRDLLKLVKDKDYFVLTTNVDDHFEKAGFDTHRIFATQGDFVNLQCSVPCHQKLYPSVDLLKEMVAQTKDRKIPTAMIPRCPRCHQPMTTHLRVDQSFVMDDYWYQQNALYNDFVHKNEDRKLLLLEFGVGFNTPSIIRFPFERQTMNHEKWHLVRFNMEYAGLIVHGYGGEGTLNDWETIKSLNYKNNFQDRFIPVSEDINEVVKRLLE